MKKAIKRLDRAGRVFLKRYNRRIVFGSDCAAVAASFVLAYLLRFDFAVTAAQSRRIVTLLPAIVCTKAVVFVGFRLYTEMWRKFSFVSCTKLVGANLTATLGLLVFSRFVGRSVYAREILLIDCLICLNSIGFIRYSYRMVMQLRRSGTFGRDVQPAKRLLIIGAGTVGESLVRELSSQNKHSLRPVAFLDDDPTRIGKTMLGVPIYGPLENLEEKVEQKHVEVIIIAIARLVGDKLKRVIAQCERAREIHGVEYRTIPGNQAIIDGKVSVSQVRKVRAEDLLRRVPVDVDTPDIGKRISGQCVMVTGGAGSIGSELVRQILGLEPVRVIVYDKAESNLFFLQQEIQDIAREKRIDMVYVVGDLCNYDKTRAVMSQYKPSTVFHAAAYKHVPLMELNPEEAIGNNVVSTQNIARISDAVGVRNFVMISTDKAVKPTNLMGASKRIAEEVVHQVAKNSKTIFTTVRFGNVIGSDGSLIPLLLKQIQKGGPVTVTHPEIERYFMTIPEAVRLVLQAMAMGTGDDIFILDMGNPIKIRELAEDVIKLAGFMPYEDIDIVFTGLRPGEKMYEELWNDGEVPSKTSHPGIRRAMREARNGTTLQDIQSIIASASIANRGDLVRKVQAFIPDARLSTAMIREAPRKPELQRPLAPNDGERRPSKETKVVVESHKAQRAPAVHHSLHS
ncbi:MAG: NAD-dependent epimerase/dehydratase family protein [Chitinivibrionales bacterium]|nr:NAD-dependent epimerase/dehydratase family protein [Chitinivibrionales bacterium]MBD3358308.1 NAD-dependent epimerase/dehydratase family protein [Chitinivibrionales bacterium]